MKAVHRYGLPLTLAVLFAAFATISPSFLSENNLRSLFVNHLCWFPWR